MKVSEKPHEYTREETRQLLLEKMLGGRNRPAIESSNGTKEWWLDGIHLRIESDWQVYDTDAGLRQQIKDLEKRIMELEERTQ